MRLPSQQFALDVAMPAPGPGIGDGDDAYLRMRDQLVDEMLEAEELARRARTRLERFDVTLPDVRATWWGVPGLKLP